MLSDEKIKNAISEVFPDEFQIVGETKVEYLINGKVTFKNRRSDTGLDITFGEYILYITSGITTLKQAYDFLKEIRKDIRKKISADEVLKELTNSEKLSERKRRALIQKAIELLEEEEKDV